MWNVGEICVQSLQYKRGLFRSLFQRGKGFISNLMALVYVAKAGRIWFRISKGQINTVAGFLLVSRLFSANPVPDSPHNKPANRIDAFILSENEKKKNPVRQFFAYSCSVPLAQKAYQCRRWNSPICTQKKLASQLRYIRTELNTVKVQDSRPQWPPGLRRRSAEIVGSNPARGIGPFLLWVLCDVS